MRGKYSISDLLHSADIHDGKCLSKEYFDIKRPVEWRCKMGHRFALGYSYVQQGAWCPQCTKKEQKQIKLEEYQSYAEGHWGKCLSKIYVNAAEEIKWECKKGHVWKQIFRNVEKYGWCKQCMKEERNKKQFLKAHSVAKKKGGKCLTSEYISSHQKMEWQCKYGHLWKAQVTHILNDHSWCPTCSGKIKHTISQMQNIARSHGGDCLSDKYSNSKTKLIWKCAKDHIWMAIPSKILSNQWCPKCRYVDVALKLKADIEELKKLAISRGGVLLSKEYKTALTSVRWRCKDGHEWSAKYGYVKHGTWCPVCAMKRYKNSKINAL